MSIDLPQDNYLKIKLLSFDIISPDQEAWYFAELSTLQATTLLAGDLKLTNLEIIADDDRGQFLGIENLPVCNTLQDFNTFWLAHLDYDLVNCDLSFENGWSIGSHDDGEVTILFPKGSDGISWIHLVFEKYGLDTQIMERLKSKPGHYFALNGAGEICAEFVDFDEYLAKGRD